VPATQQLMAVNTNDDKALVNEPNNGKASANKPNGGKASANEPTGGQSIRRRSLLWQSICIGGKARSLSAAPIEWLIEWYVCVFLVIEW